MKFIRNLSILLFCILLLACSRVTEDNYDRIESGMEEAAVIKILGNPDESSSMGIGSLSGKSSVWDDGKARISIQFFNDKVKLKNFGASEKEGT
ncbi:MAG: hypothetical protein E2O62_04605 [Gammaproteobacteria bacterium]|nr:hypothetical protein [Pseudomonadota bacterium]MCH8261645.1 hypothetical protein [Pseudomonadota bacterium]MCH9047497.1 hypothetical protein [Pseudomonadota bacterium]TDJ17883.1 MAG: hypothetical protein E2O62_04605 [Gammaproteobacteria bacterium]